MAFLINNYEPEFVDYNNRVELLKAYEWKKEVAHKKKDPVDFSEVANYESKVGKAVFHAVTTFIPRNKDAKNAKKSKKIEMFQQRVWAYDQAYLPRGVNSCQRLRLSRDLSCNTEVAPVPVFCDLDRDSTDVIFTDNFQYRTKSLFIHKKDEIFYSRYRISCNCKDGCKRGHCACVELHYRINGEEALNLGDGRVQLKNPVPDMYTYCVVMCGELCGCPPTCHNRIENALGKNRFEIFRRNAGVGFGVRTLNSIALGELVMEFTGEVNPGSVVNSDTRRLNYAMEIYDDKEFVSLARRIQRALPKYPTTMFDSKEPDLFIDPWQHGNVARFLTFGCFPNLNAIRIITNWVHPARHRIVFQATRHITPGSELSFIYGKEYKTRCVFKCLCGTPMCRSTRGSGRWFEIADTEVDKAMMFLQSSWRVIAKAKDEEFERCLAKKKEREDDGIIPLTSEGQEVPQSLETLFDSVADAEEPREAKLLEESGDSRDTNGGYIANPLQHEGVEEGTPKKNKRKQSMDKKTEKEKQQSPEKSEEEAPPKRKAVAVVSPMVQKETAKAPVRGKELVTLSDDDEPTPSVSKMQPSPRAKNPPPPPPKKKNAKISKAKTRKSSTSKKASPPKATPPTPPSYDDDDDIVWI